MSLVEWGLKTEMNLNDEKMEKVAFHTPELWVETHTP